MPQCPRHVAGCCPWRLLPLAICWSGAHRMWLCCSPLCRTLSHAASPEPACSAHSTGHGHLDKQSQALLPGEILVLDAPIASALLFPVLLPNRLKAAHASPEVRAAQGRGLSATASHAGDAGAGVTRRPSQTCHEIFSSEPPLVVTARYLPLKG